MGHRMILALGIVGACSSHAEPKLQELKRFEASGVVRQGDELLLVHDEVPGAFFRLHIESAEGILTYGADEPRRVNLEELGEARDLESLAIGDGRVFVLSEERAELLGQGDSRYRYASYAAPIGNRGLEGLAIRPRVGESDLVAALFEGGYLKKSQLKGKLQAQLAGSALDPFVITHALPGVGERLAQAEDPKAERVDLLLGSLPGKVKKGQRFRAVDLVWHPLKDGTWTWIVLLSSDAPPKKSSKHSHLWLQRFDMQGAPLGKHFDLGDWLKEKGKKYRDQGDWEGLGWWEPGLSLVLADDTGKKKSHLAFVPLPAGWDSVDQDG
jgi:hypothetical protein